MLRFPERRGGLLLAIIGALFVMAYVANLVLRPKPDGRIVVGDALHHYVQLRSMVFDRDLHFQNEYMRLYGLRGGEPGAEWVFEDTPTGHVRNLMPVGPALLWAPLFFAAGLVTAVANALGAGLAMDGYNRLFQASAGLTGILAATAGIWFSWRLCVSLAGERSAAWSCVCLWIGSSAIYYSLVSPAYSHATSLLATSVFWYAWWRTRERTDATRYGLLGVLAGVAALMRWQDAILVVPVALDMLRAARRHQIPAAAFVRLGAWGAAGFTLAFAPQMAVWTVLYGQPLALPQGPDFMRWGEPALLQVLFSSWHGLFTWTPLVAVALVGLYPLWRRDVSLALGMTVFLALSWYVNAAVADWWAGEAFGSRRFVSCFPVFAACLAAAIQWWSPSLPKLAAAAGAVSGYSLLLLVQYQAYMHGLRDVVPYPGGFYDLWVARFVVPWNLARAWLDR